MSKPLITAIEANDANAVRTAAKKVKDLNRKLPKSTTPLLLAADRGADHAVEALLDAGASPDGGDSFYGNHPFVIAEKHGHTAVMQIFAARNLVPPNVLDHAIFHALHFNHPQTLTLMLEHLRPAIRENWLDLASHWKDGRLLDLLLQHGGNINTPTKARTSICSAKPPCTLPHAVATLIPSASLPNATLPGECGR